jgi:hypothetical protein
MSNLFDDDDDNASFGNRNSNKRYEENDELRNIQQKIGIFLKLFLINYLILVKSFKVMLKMRV